MNTQSSIGFRPAPDFADTAFFKMISVPNSVKSRIFKINYNSITCHISLNEGDYGCLFILNIYASTDNLEMLVSTSSWFRQLSVQQRRFVCSGIWNIWWLKCGDLWKVYSFVICIYNYSKSDSHCFILFSLIIITTEQKNSAWN